MADDKIRMPSSGGGLIRYYDEYKSKYEFPPIYVAVAVAAVLVLCYNSALHETFRMIPNIDPKLMKAAMKKMAKIRQEKPAADLVVIVIFFRNIIIRNPKHNEDDIRVARKALR